MGFASLALGWALAWFLGAGPGSMVSMCGVIWGVIGTMGLAIKKDDDDRYAGGWAP
ncbi:hypothetical protein [Streptomyces achromogenes]|uniref:hypothetical protein n=1 Tax=Streptomyces achromogenes TaxID=67255 RepID=UPI0027D799D9|nr:hypothetical protein [Streptomyces achromogenes]